MRGIGDVERILSRIALRSARPRDLSQLAFALSRLPEIRSTTSDNDSPLLASLSGQIKIHLQEKNLLDKALVEDPPQLISQGGIIADGYDDELDELRAISKNADQFLIDLEAREKSRTGIATLKLGYKTAYTVTTSRSAKARPTRRQPITCGGKR